MKSTDKAHHNSVGKCEQIQVEMTNNEDKYDRLRYSTLQRYTHMISGIHIGTMRNQSVRVFTTAA